MSKEEEEILLNYIPPECNSREDVVKFLIDEKCVSNTFLTRLKVFYTYREARTTERKEAAMFDAAIEHGVSATTVRRARKRFER